MTVLLWIFVVWVVLPITVEVAVAITIYRREARTRRAVRDLDALFDLPCPTPQGAREHTRPRRRHGRATR